MPPLIYLLQVLARTLLGALLEAFGFAMWAAAGC